MDIGPLKSLSRLAPTITWYSVWEQQIRKLFVHDARSSKRDRLQRAGWSNDTAERFNFRLWKINTANTDGGQ